MSISMIFVILALVCFLIGTGNAPWINWVSLGLAFFMMSQLIGRG